MAEQYDLMGYLSNYDPVNTGTSGLGNFEAYAPTPPSANPAGGGVMDKMGGVGNVVAGAGSVIGGVSSIYGSYQQKKMAEKNYELAKKAFDDQVARAEKMDKTAEEQRQLQNMMTEAQYANDTLTQGGERYGMYNQMTGE